ncbi:helix-turn-helix domain-containing protein [Arthrobacter sp. D1-29]
MSISTPVNTTPRVQPGSQTLARGLTALIAITDSRSGMTIQEVADQLSVHRSIAYRLLQTFVDFGFISRSDDSVYRPGARLASLATSYYPSLRELALPIMRQLAEELGSTIALFVAEGKEAAAISMVEPTTTLHHISFKAGMRTPLDRGSAAYALVSGMPPVENEPPEATKAREVGFARSFGEIEEGAYGVGAFIPTQSPGPVACVHLITYRGDVAEMAGPVMKRAAAAIGTLLSDHSHSTPSGS